MTDRRQVANDPAEPMVLSFAGQSPHVFTYKVWVKRPADDDWSDSGCAGDTEDEDPPRCELGVLPDGTLLDIPIAIGGRRQSAYNGELVFSQQGTVVTGGTVAFSGTTSDEGAAVEYIRLVLA